MDIVTLAMAKAYSDSKGGYTNPGKAYTFDGILDGKETIEAHPGMVFVKVSDNTCDPYSIDYAVLTTNSSNNTIGKEMLSVEDAGGTHNVSVDGMPGFVIADDHPDFSHGIWVVYLVNDDGAQYVSKIQLTETIVPIDPKFLPGVCLPVVELTTELVLDTPVELNDTENAILTKAAEDKVPIIIAFQLSMSETIANFANIAPLFEVDGIPSYGCTVFQNGLEVVSDGAGKWTVTLVQIN